MAASEKDFDLDKHGLLAYQWCDQILPLQVCHSAAGYYIGTMDPEDGSPMSRESVMYWRDKAEAEKALASGNWQQKEQP